MNLQEAINEFFRKNQKDPLEAEHQKLAKILDKQSIKALGVMDRREVLEISLKLKVGKIKEAGKMITKASDNARQFIDDVITQTLGNSYFKKKGALRWKA